MKVKSLFFVILFTASSIFAQSLDIKFTGNFNGKQGKEEKETLKDIALYTITHYDESKENWFHKSLEKYAIPPPILPPSAIKKATFHFYRNSSEYQYKYGGVIWIPLPVIESTEKEFVLLLLNTIRTLQGVTSSSLSADNPDIKPFSFGWSKATHYLRNTAIVLYNSKDERIVIAPPVLRDPYKSRLYLPTDDVYRLTELTGAYGKYFIDLDVLTSFLKHPIK